MEGPPQPEMGCLLSLQGGSEGDRPQTREMDGLDGQYRPAWCDSRHFGFNRIGGGSDVAGDRFRRLNLDSIADCWNEYNHGLLDLRLFVIENRVSDQSFRDDTCTRSFTPIFSQTAESTKHLESGLESALAFRTIGTCSNCPALR